MPNYPNINLCSDSIYCISQLYSTSAVWNKCTHRKQAVQQTLEWWMKHKPVEHNNKASIKEMPSQTAALPHFSKVHLMHKCSIPPAENKANHNTWFSGCCDDRLPTRAAASRWKGLWRSRGWQVNLYGRILKLNMKHTRNRKSTQETEYCPLWPNENWTFL